MNGKENEGKRANFVLFKTQSFPHFYSSSSYTLNFRELFVAFFGSSFPFMVDTARVEFSLPSAQQACNNAGGAGFHVSRHIARHKRETRSEKGNEQFAKIRTADVFLCKMVAAKICRARRVGGGENTAGGKSFTVRVFVLLSPFLPPPNTPSLPDCKPPSSDLLTAARAAVCFDLLRHHLQLYIVSTQSQQHHT